MSGSNRRSDSSPPPSFHPPKWTLVDNEPLQDCAVFQVARARTRSPHTGRVHDFYRIDSPDWVNVVPITSRDEIVMVHQFRHGPRALTLEIPGGMVDEGEAPARAAARELLEETGYRAASVDAVGSVSPNPALFGNRVHMYVARGCEKIAEPANEGTEETVVELVPRAELAARVRAGHIDHALVVAALFWWELEERSRGSQGSIQGP